MEALEAEIMDAFYDQLAEVLDDDKHNDARWYPEDQGEQAATTSVTQPFIHF